ncbi:hypothetical protein [Prolixibacter bellariivorans]|uniref:hypothetical protein n=1 Tax=Prolixibacter bellariivorans TaxID=314319 RepID=UPI000470AC96|nr:hypothetical protein [Prolixibacter bellariivorans]
MKDVRSVTMRFQQGNLGTVPTSVAVGNFQVQIPAVIKPNVLFGIGKIVGTRSLSVVFAVPYPPVVTGEVDDARTIDHPVVIYRLFGFVPASGKKQDSYDQKNPVSLHLFHFLFG